MTTTQRARAVRYTRYGDPDVLSLDTVDLPEPGPGEVRVAVRAAAVNPYDWKARRGLYAGDQAPARPARVGLEFAGTVDAVGPDVTGWSAGDAVFGLGSGTAATHIVVAADGLVAKPRSMSFVQAAALPVACETAYRAIRLLDVTAADVVLVHAAAGAVGLVATQLALVRGARVIGTAGTANHEFLASLGAEPVLYGDGLADRVRALAPRGVDAVLDASGRDVLPVSVELAGGPERVVTIADGSAEQYGVRATWSADLPLPQVFETVLPLVEQGAVQLPVAGTFPLEQVAEAQTVSESGHLRGKLVLTVGDPA
ncbi:NADP-dependent oxidoreductase [Jiangella ureilytica]|uniref:NADP-dependent oxidoreductase n=1 Tax=Jiangella ureilytica TaxID=2530374 RepID=A0A4R4RWM5_9ACTN|nr:NADP-dependent oxidoreductase [Jiangella ureilytica]TDC54587.1 NADP-dependent oxidoreductase [Jiangella ureilytica]